MLLNLLIQFLINVILIVFCRNTQQITMMGQVELNPSPNALQMLNKQTGVGTALQQFCNIVVFVVKLLPTWILNKV